MTAPEQPRRPLCARCRLAFRRVVMDDEGRGSWTGERRFRCPRCQLIEYPDMDGSRRYGGVQWA